MNKNTNCDVKIAVHLHLYYIEQLDEMLRLLHHLDGYALDLFVTMNEIQPEIEQKIRNFQKNAVIWQVENRGYDVGPFVDFLHRINLEKYDYVLKIHTKRKIYGQFCYLNKHRFNMATWRKMLLSALLSKSVVNDNIRRLEDNPKIGMLGSAWCLTGDEADYRQLLSELTTQIDKIGFKVPQNKDFIAGTMFWVRARLLKPFLFYQIGDFAVTNGKCHDGTLAHLLERLFGWAITAQGYEIYGVEDRKYFWARVWAGLCRFVWQKKRTRNGKILIKICKIPVYHGSEK